MKVTDKSPQVEAVAKHFATNKKDRQEIADSKECAMCDEPNLEFRNELSKREYSISLMCQDCQDKIFGADNG